MAKITMVWLKILALGGKITENKLHIGGVFVMATSKEYIEFVCEQIGSIGDIRYRKMFGEYMVYLNDKPIFLVCDNTVYIKKLDEITKLIDAQSVGTPYSGAKEHFILDIENSELAKEVSSVLERITPVPKPRKKKS